MTFRISLKNQVIRNKEKVGYGMFQSYSPLQLGHVTLAGKE